MSRLGRGRILAPKSAKCIRLLKPCHLATKSQMLILLPLSLNAKVELAFSDWQLIYLIASITPWLETWWRLKVELFVSSREKDMASMEKKIKWLLVPVGTLLTGDS